MCYVCYSLIYNVLAFVFLLLLMIRPISVKKKQSKVKLLHFDWLKQKHIVK